MGKVVKLQSGQEIDITEADFEVAKSLYQAIWEEARSVVIHTTTEIDTNFIKDMFCTGISSKKVEALLWLCFPKVLYRGRKIDKDSFIPVENREDYFPICFEVARENIAPFSKTLMQQFSLIRAGLEKLQA